MTQRDPHLSYLCTRNLKMRELNARELSDREWDALTAETLKLEEAIRSTPAITLEGFTAKLMLEIETLREGFTPNDDTVSALIREGRDTFGIGDFITPAFEQENAA